MAIKVLQGVFIGIAFVLPGLSAGTVILILGFYRRFLDDIAAVRIRPYLPMIAGALVGSISGVYAIGFLMSRNYELVTAFLLGMLLASVQAVVNRVPALRDLPRPLIFGALGFILTWFYICEPTRTFTVFPPGGPLHFFLGGVLASATMLLPGVSGSAVLIVMNLYDDVIIAVSTWQWLRLAILGAGFAVGLFGLARLLSALYRRYQAEISFLLAGLILGSTRVLLPAAPYLLYIVTAGAGAIIVLYFTRRKHS